MLGIRVESEVGEHVLRPTDEAFRELVRRIGGDGDKFLVVERVDAEENVYIQVWHEAGGNYQLEHRAGGPDRHYRVDVDNAETVAEVMVGWALRASGWDDPVEWERVDLGADQEPVPELDPEMRETLEERVREVLRTGYADRHELAETAEEYLVDGDDRPVSGAQAWALVQRLWRERLAEEAGWEGVTDPERIEEVFAGLEERGITARPDFTCCRNCGMSEIGAEGAEGARGFVFFHRQATESAASGGGLSLYYGGFDGAADTTAAVGREVADALGAAGFTVEWNGSPDKAISVEGLDWRKRLPGQATG
ncbi:hypothetical protein SRB5_12530 [Streptomyces sp. RB5]|uniref:DUF6891 domain-containing protein n=1 Tax=Streptomyces smaragdinus TaxID=2585196 RepID=A0A7K0CCH3_9ACTN|nr:hypothetical protein [Streptomyces smaragdinus]MQY11139.1 hypothetical protein [Streptomyces smaragdinus]